MFQIFRVKKQLIPKIKEEISENFNFSIKLKRRPKSE